MALIVSAIAAAKIKVSSSNELLLDEDVDDSTSHGIVALISAGENEVSSPNELLLDEDDKDSDESSDRIDESSDRIDETDDMNDMDDSHIDDSDEIDASDDIDMALNFLLLVCLLATQRKMFIDQSAYRSKFLSLSL